MPLIGIFTFYLRRRAQVKTRTVSIQLLNGQQVPITWFRFLLQAKLRHFSFFRKHFLKQMIDESNNYQLGLDFFYRQNSDIFSISFSLERWLAPLTAQKW